MKACFWCGCQVHQNTGAKTGFYKPHIATRDHVIAKKFGARETVLACWMCNQIRNWMLCGKEIIKKKHRRRAHIIRLKEQALGIDSGGIPMKGSK